MYIFIYVSQIKTANNINTVDDLVFFFGNLEMRWNSHVFFLIH